MADTPTAVAGANVRAEMARRGITQQTLARELGISQAALSARLRGQTPLDINELTRIAELFELPLRALVSAELAS